MSFPGATFKGVQQWDGRVGLGRLGCNPGDWGTDRLGKEDLKQEHHGPGCDYGQIELETGAPVQLSRLGNGTVATSGPGEGVQTPFERLLKKMFARMNVASGPYQMVSVRATAHCRALRCRCGAMQRAIVPTPNHL